MNIMWESDDAVDKLISQYDSTSMPVPDFESEPQLLISKVRKHYMEYLIKILSVNYETNQKLVNKNIYLPSAIWRCAKNIETTAAQMCMVVQLYRKNIVSVVKELKNDTKKGKLNKKLFECLHTPPQNEKKLQTTISFEKTCDCVCNCKQKKKRRKVSESPKTSQIAKPTYKYQLLDMDTSNEFNNIPVLISSQVEPSQTIGRKETITQTCNENVALANQQSANLPSKPPERMSVDSQESDELMLQLEKLFQGDGNDDDLFEGGWMESITHDDSVKKTQSDNPNNSECNPVSQTDNSVIENHSLQIKSLDERLASLTGLLSNNSENNSVLQKTDTVKQKRCNTNKWLCEEYFLKSQLFELLDDIGDTNRKKLARIKEMLLELFGDDSDDEGVVSPFDETPEFITSCKERIAPWVVKILTPYYIKGRIRGKALFKSLAKHLIRLIYQCSRYPREYEVQSFVTDFLENHKMIRCEADFKQFRIENL